MFGRAYKRGLDVARASDRLTALLFGVGVHRKVIPTAWDVTTLCVKKALDASMPPGPFRYLDMGCGHLGLLGQYVKRRRPDAEVVSVDLYRAFADNARWNAERNGLDVAVVHGDLYGAVSGRFDLVSFNPPYKPDDGGPHASYPATTFSGPDGLDASRGLLAGGREHLTDRGRILLGINCFFVPEDRCLRAIAEAGWTVERVVRRRFNTARVFVLAPGDREGG